MCCKWNPGVYILKIWGKTVVWKQRFIGKGRFYLQTGPHVTKIK